MDAEFKVKWIDALRSGDYKQGQNLLRSNDAFCCLGVLCDLHDPDGWHHDAGFSLRTFGPHEVSGYLPIDLRDRLGLSLQDEATVAAMNDDGKSFEKIADYIEQNL